MIEPLPKPAAAANSETATVLSIRALSVDFDVGTGSAVHAARRVDLDIRPGEVVGLVGESGSGKSTVAYAILRGLEANARIVSGAIRYRDQDLLALPATDLRKLRGRRIALVPQDPSSALNPAIVVGEQIAEVLREHEGLSEKAATARTVELLRQVRLPSPTSILQRYPYQLSGGQQQRIAIAMAFACRPDLLIMDEPTTGLDVTTEARVLDLVGDLIATERAAVLYITHNLGVVARFCQRVLVMYAGEIVETGDVAAVFRKPAHPYTQALLQCLPRLGQRKSRAHLSSIPGSLPDLQRVSNSCIFVDRCRFAQPLCREQAPPDRPRGDGGHSRCWFDLPFTVKPDGQDGRSAPHLSWSENPLLQIRLLTCEYRQRRKLSDLWRGATPFTITAVNSVSLDLRQGRTVAVVGESGCGKTTLARAIAGLVRPVEGEIRLSGDVLAPAVAGRPQLVKRTLQMVFQNPETTLNPQKAAAETLARPLRLYGIAGRADVGERVANLLHAVQLPSAVSSRYPHQLSGGQKQRLAIARAFAAEPQLVICDEPLSALDVSVQAAIVNLLVELQEQTGCSYLFISHDLSLVLYFADVIVVLYRGSVCEVGSPDAIFSPPYHPYTEALLAAIPLADPAVRQRTIRLREEPETSQSFRRGCPFQDRCPRKIGQICEDEVPPIHEPAPGHTIACHHPLEVLSAEGPVVTTHEAAQAAEVVR